MLRQQVPVYAPLTGRAVWAGWTALAKTAPRPHDDINDILKRAFQARGVLVTDSGTSALMLALRAVIREQPRRPVALPAYSCYDVATASDATAAPVLLYDLDPATLGPDLDSLEHSLRNGASAVVVAHLYGVPVDLGAVAELCEAFGVFLIEDAAQSAGASLEGRPLGSYGSLAVLSFGRGKGLTGGGGGALLAHDDWGCRAIEHSRASVGSAKHAWLDALRVSTQWLLGRPHVYALPASLPFLRLGQTIYRAPRPAHEMSRVSARVLETVWPLAVRELAVRRYNAQLLLKQVAASRHLRPIHGAPGGTPGYLRLPLLAGATADPLILDSHARRLGVTAGYPVALVDLPGFRDRCDNCGGSFPGARLLTTNLATLPTHSLLAPRDLKALWCWIHEFGNEAAASGGTLSSPRLVR